MARIDRNIGAFVNGEGSGIYSPHCPKCQTMIHAQAIVDEFMQPDTWIFYGEKGKRVATCSGELLSYKFIHFAVQASNGISQRLAWEEVK